MKALRRSVTREKEGGKPNPQHASITPKSSTAIVPPKRVGLRQGVSSGCSFALTYDAQVIKALYDYQPSPTDSHYLNFTKGDFFHVISREDDPDWYEACNPLIPLARGLVPVSYFEIIGKTERQSGGSTRFESTTNTTKSVANARSSIHKSAGALVYGEVQYDFNAERPDELEAQAGEPIIVIAQSDPDWFVAKPIRRLGGPGLIPVSFIEIKDPSTGRPVTDPVEAVRRAGVPRVEEWKKMAADYKNSSFNLGKADAQQQAGSDSGRMSVGAAGSGTPYPNKLMNGRASHQQTPSRSGPAQGQYYQQPLLAPISASLPRYCFDNDMYWYIIECQMEDGQYWQLSRYYADFYDFQIALLNEFPEEAGNVGQPRTLPFMPGPVAHVTDAISNGRRQNLDEYIRKILSMPPHISRSRLVRELFAPRQGDSELDPNALDEDYRLSEASQHSQPHDLSASASRQSPNGAMNGNAYGGMPPPGRPFHPRGQSSLSAGQGAPATTSGFLQPMNRQASSLTQGSGTSGNPPTSAGAMKVKVNFQDETVVIRLPSDSNFGQLKDRVKERLRVMEDVLIQYKDKPSNSSVDLTNDSDLDVALQRNDKLTLSVNYAS